MFHASMSTLEFGGVGQSGQGSYRGKASFDAFTHRRAVLTTPSWMEKLISLRYPPYTAGKIAQYKRSFALKPHFDRAGRTKLGLLSWILAPKTLLVALGKSLAKLFGRSK
jgi:beta-apo-4'-carotenal oxygenase